MNINVPKTSCSITLKDKTQTFAREVAVELCKKQVNMQIQDNKPT